MNSSDATMNADRSDAKPHLSGVVQMLLAGVFAFVGVGATITPSASFFTAVASATTLVPPNSPTLDAPRDSMRVFHLGHSLVGRDMPAMVQQLAQAAGFETHAYESQLGWGASLRSHWEPEVEIPGFETENAHARFRDAHEAIESGDYDAFVLTEMVELRDAIRWHESPDYVRRWLQSARAARPDMRVYLYETWHNLNDPAGWMNRLQADASTLWEQALLAPSWSDPDLGPIHVIPAGRVVAAFAQALEAAGGTSDMSSHEALFARFPDGTLDPIHMSDRGLYLIALIHFAVLYHQPVAGLPHELLRADGTPAEAPSADTAALMQQVVWDVVSSLQITGIGA